MNFSSLKPNKSSAHRYSIQQKNVSDNTFRKPNPINQFEINNSKYNFSDIPINASFIQPKLTINQPNDIYEQEADATAEKIMQKNFEPDSKLNFSRANVQRKCKECEEEETNGLQRKENNNAAISISQAVNKTLQSPGKPIDNTARAFMEQGFGHSFQDIKIYDNALANQSAKDINARAYTHKNNIVFGAGEYNPQTITGKRLLAHELTHAIQQNDQHSLLQRAPKLYGGATGAPSDWSTKVVAATDAKSKVALIQSVLGSTVTVVDKTAQSSGDTSPDPAHLSPYTASSATINYDDNLNSKTARAGGRSLNPDAGYTLSSGNNNYVILSSKVLDIANYYTTLFTVNHEMDHVRQSLNKSTLKGNASELDAWTSSFIREFHKSYVIQEQSSGDCIVRSAQQYVPLLGYYEGSGVSASDKTNAVKRISDYYNATIKSNPAHLAIFKYWLRRSLNQTKHALADDIIAGLTLSITSADSMHNYTKFSCTGVTGQTYSSPSLSLPTFPATGGTKKP